jgi:hypothetical protein
MNKEPGGTVAEVWSATHNARHVSDQRTARGLNKTPSDPLIGWRRDNPSWDAAWRVEQSVYWRWSRAGYEPPPDGVWMPPPVQPKLPGEP